MYINATKEATMKILKIHSIRYLKKLLCCLLFTLIFSIQNKINAIDVEEMKNPSIIGSKPIKEECSDNIIDDIINGKFREDVDYLSTLPSSSGDDEEVDLCMMGYAYQVLGQHYMIEKKDASKAALSYFRSLKCYPFNEELTFYLKKIGVKNFSNGDIEKALEKIIRK